MTRTWLVKHIDDDDYKVTDEFQLRNVVNKVVAHAYLELLKWDDEKLLPEVSCCLVLYFLHVQIIKI